MSGWDHNDKQNPLIEYVTYRVDKDDATYIYILSEHVDGSWVATRITRSTLLFEYSRGNNNVETAFTNRASLIYGSISEVF
jgi:hypothetical protein